VHRCPADEGPRVRSDVFGPEVTVPLFGELGPSGALGAGYELDSPKTARTVRVRDGETLVTDGPFADTKEQIGGLMELEAEDLDAAIAIAARIPVVFRASVELRPVVEH